MFTNLAIVWGPHFVNQHKQLKVTMDPSFLSQCFDSDPVFMVDSTGSRFCACFLPESIGRVSPKKKTKNVVKTDVASSKLQNQCQNKIKFYLLANVNNDKIHLFCSKTCGAPQVWLPSLVCLILAARRFFGFLLGSQPAKKGPKNCNMQSMA